MLRDARRVAQLPPTRRAMIDADRLPIIAGRREPRQEYPARRLRIETGIVLEPMPNLGFGPPHERRNFGHPPAFDFQRPQIMTAISIDPSGADPVAFLIAQPPQRPSAPR